MTSAAAAGTMLIRAFLLATGFTAQIVASAPAFDEEVGITTDPTEHIAGADLPHNVYYTSAWVAGTARTLLKRHLNSEETVWEKNYTYTKGEQWRSVKQVYDKAGNIYEVAVVFNAANTVALRKFDGQSGAVEWEKKLNPCAGWSPDYTVADIAITSEDVVGVSVSCSHRELDTDKHATIVYGLDAKGSELFKNADIPGATFARIRSSGDDFVVNTAAYSGEGEYRGIWVTNVNATNGELLQRPTLWRAGLGAEPENAEEAAILSTIAYGLGASAIDGFTMPTDDTGLEYLQDIHAAEGTSAYYVIGRAYQSDGPTYLIAYDLESGKHLASVEVGPGLPLGLYVQGDRVGVLSYETADVIMGDELAVYNFKL